MPSAHCCYGWYGGHIIPAILNCSKSETTRDHEPKFPIGDNGTVVSLPDYEEQHDDGSRWAVQMRRRKTGKM